MNGSWKETDVLVAFSEASGEITLRERTGCSNVHYWTDQSSLFALVNPFTDVWGSNK